jgi:lysyl-tRNA synthetase class 2
MPDSASDLLVARRRKLEALRDGGRPLYPNDFVPSDTAADVHARFGETTSEVLAAKKIDVRVAGRIVGGIRDRGKAAFFHVQDRTGRLQVYVKREDLGEEGFEIYRLADAGDIVAVEGTLFRTRTGELSVAAGSFRILTKALRPLPEKWHGLSDTEIRYRQRYLDLIANPEARRIFETRTRIVSAIRRFLDRSGYVEVETPVLQPLYGGAAARPFQTYHNEMERNLFLRISDELYLKRLVIGGFERVYEIGHDFRNEGIDTKHNPEFTMIECYRAYATYLDMMKLAEDMISDVAREVLGSTVIEYQGHPIDLAPPWRRLPLREAILEHSGIDVDEHSTVEALWGEILRRGITLDKQPSWGKLVDKLLDATVKPTLVQPAFIMDHPVEMSPLARRKSGDARRVERFEPFAGTLELGDAWSELNDPGDQRDRFVAQAQLSAAGETETQPFDEEWVEALEYGMPPTGGLGIGVDRLVMLLTNQTSIREVILFPLLRPTSREA